MTATDIIICTYNRLPLLKRTLEYVFERTMSPYRLSVIDDASTEGNVAYLRELHAQSKIAGLMLRGTRAGISANLRAIAAMTTSDPVVLTDDDVLCPKLTPDWLARGLDAMQRYPQLGVCTLNNPHCNVTSAHGKPVRGWKHPEELVTFCSKVGGTFLFIRRPLLLLVSPMSESKSPIKQMCISVVKLGWRIGYLTDVYCQHIGTRSVRNNRDLQPGLELVLPTNSDTLEPPDAYKR